MPLLGSRLLHKSGTSSVTITIAPPTLPAGIGDTAYSQTVTASGGSAPYAYTVTAGALPTGLTLHSGTGVIDGAPTVANTFSFTITATDANLATGNQPYSILITAPVISLSPSSLPAGTAESAYSQTVTASGGAAPYTYAVTAGSLPTGLTLHSGTGVIDGTPTTVQNPSFTVTATDVNAFTGAKAYSVNIVAPVIVVPSSPPAGVVASAYSYSFAASGGVGPYTYAVTAGSLPSSLSLNAGTGLLSGTPDRVATSTFTITATDAGGFTGTSGSVSVSVTISYLLQDEYTTNASAPLTTPRTCEPGPGTLTFTDTGNKVSIASQQLTMVSNTGVNDPYVRDTSGFARTAGLALLHSSKIGGNGGSYIGLANTLTPGAAATQGVQANGSAALANTVDGAVLGEPRSGSTLAVYATVLQSTGSYLFKDGNLIWIQQIASDATMFIVAFNNPTATTATIAQEYLRLRQLAGSQWTTLNGLATLNIASPTNNTDYVGNADEIVEMTLVAAGTILTTGGFRFHVQGATDYWYAYFDTAGHFKLDCVTAGTPANKIDVAGAIVAGATRNIRVIHTGALLDCYTFTSPNWFKRGAQTSLATFDTQAGIHTDYGADWTVSNLRSFPRSSAAYAALGDS